MGLLDGKDIATTGQKIEVKSKRNDPRFFQANDLLKQIDDLKTLRTKCLNEAEKYRVCIDTLEAQFHRIVLELEPTEVAASPTQRSPKDDLAKRLQNALAGKLAASPGLEEQLNKILASMK